MLLDLVTDPALTGAEPARLRSAASPDRILKSDAAGIMPDLAAAYMKKTDPILKAEITVRARHPQEVKTLEHYMSAFHVYLRSNDHSLPPDPEPLIALVESYFGKSEREDSPERVSFMKNHMTGAMERPIYHGSAQIRLEDLADTPNFITLAAPSPDVEGRRLVVFGRGIYIRALREEGYQKQIAEQKMTASLKKTKRHSPEQVARAFMDAMRTGDIDAAMMWMAPEMKAEKKTRITLELISKQLRDEVYTGQLDRLTQFTEQLYTNLDGTTHFVAIRIAAPGAAMESYYPYGLGLILTSTPGGWRVARFDGAAPGRSLSSYVKAFTAGRGESRPGVKHVNLLDVDAHKGPAVLDLASGELLDVPKEVSSEVLLSDKHIAGVAMEGDGDEATVIFTLNAVGRDKLRTLAPAMPGNHYLAVFLGGEVVPAKAVEHDPKQGTISIKLDQLSKSQAEKAQNLAGRFLAMSDPSQMPDKKLSPRKIQKLIHTLVTTKDNGVRASCANELGYAGATDAVPALIDALKIPDWRVRRSAVNALGYIADPRAIDPLIGILNEESADPNLWEGRRCAVCAFVNLKSKKVVPVLIRMLADNPGRDDSGKIDYTTALLAALGAQQDHRAIPAIVGLLDGPSGSRAAAALGNIVGVDFTDDGDPLRLPMPSPAKAKAWLEAHPEIVEDGSAETQAALAELDAKIRKGLAKDKWNETSRTNARKLWEEYCAAYIDPLKQPVTRSTFGKIADVKEYDDYLGTYGREPRPDLPFIKVTKDEAGRFHVELEGHTIPAVLSNKTVVFTTGDIVYAPQPSLSDKPSCTLEMMMLIRTDGQFFLGSPSAPPERWLLLSKITKNSNRASKEQEIFHQVIEAFLDECRTLKVDSLTAMEKQLGLDVLRQREKDGEDMEKADRRTWHPVLRELVEHDHGTDPYETIRKTYVDQPSPYRKEAILLLKVMGYRCAEKLKE